MSDNLEVSLWDMVGVGLILIGESNVSYTNQVGGTACLNKTEEGFFVPYNNDYHEERFTDSFEYNLSKIFDGYQENHLNEIVIKKLNDFFKNNDQLTLLSIDKELTSQSCESWIYVKLNRDIDSVKNRKIEKGVLTWPNSD